MKSIRKTVCLVLVVLAVAYSLGACGEISGNKTDKLNIVCTIFPEYDWVRNILGSHFADAEVTLLLDNGVDLHSFQPTVDDVITITNCDVFIYVGGESDSWVDDVLAESKNDKMIVINLLDVLGDAVKEEETVDGMQGEHDHEHEEESGEEETEYDEHVWLSLRNAATICSAISAKLASADPDNGADYAANCETYKSSLKSLDDEYVAAVAASKHKTVLFGDRFPFRYLVNDYDISYFAAFVGCSAETEASFETIIFLANKVDELGLGTVMMTEGSDGKIAGTVVSNTTAKNQTVRALNSMQSTTSGDVAGGVTYLSVMRANLEVLKLALN